MTVNTPACSCFFDSPQVSKARRVLPALGNVIGVSLFTTRLARFAKTCCCIRPTFDSAAVRAEVLLAGKSMTYARV